MNCSTDKVLQQTSLHDLALGMDGTSGKKLVTRGVVGRLEIASHSLTLFSEFPDTL